MNSSQIGYDLYNLRHANATLPTSRRMGTNLSNASRGKFAVSDQKQLLIRGVRVFFRHTSQPLLLECRHHAKGILTSGANRVAREQASEIDDF
jgi:hypothetical protein